MSWKEYLRKKKESVEWWLNASVGGNIDAYTTADGKQLFGIIGDSTGGTSDTGPGPTPTSGTVFEWTGSVENEITNADLSTAADNTGSTAGANAGSPWPQMGITYYNGYSRKSVFIDCHVGGSEFTPNGDNSNWSSTGTLRGTAETKIDSAITEYGVTPKAIFVELGSNDIRHNVAIATVLSDIDAFFTWITTKYPNTDIVCLQPGQTDQVNGSANTQGSERAHQIRARIKQNALNNSRVHLYGNAGTVENYDNLHFTQSGNNHVGRMAANWLLNDSYSKWARSIIASQYTEPTSAQKTLIENWVSAINYTTGLDTFLPFRKMSTEKDAFNDWGFETFASKVATLTLGENGFTGSGAGYLRSKFFGSAALHATTDDFYCGSEVISQTGNGALFGARNASTTAEMSVQFTTSNRSYRANDVTATSVTGDFTDGNSYYVARDAGNKILYSNTTAENTTAQASTAAMTKEFFIFARNNNDTADVFMTGTGGFWVYGKKTVLQPVFHSATQTLLNNW
jgi:hypothetical protein